MKSHFHSVIYASDVTDPQERSMLSERMLDRIDAALNYDGRCRFDYVSHAPKYGPESSR